ncbi:MAG: tetratricopeptide repeat protein, partial [Chloroflexi bacterium]|nr:tetratricopeptide repeat protein [Chloroflexota bacterium]
WYVLHQGGQFLPQLRSHPRLSVVACLLGLSSEATLETRQAFEDEITDSGPEEFYILTDLIDRDRETMTIGEVLSWIRCSRWDTTMFRRLFHVLLKQLESAPELVRRDVHAMVQRVWEDYFFIGEDDDVATRLGMLLGEMEFYSEALTFFDRALQLYTPTANTYYMMAVCHIHLKEWDAALERVNQALALDPVLENARLLRLKLEAEVGRQQASDANTYP